MYTCGVGQGVCVKKSARRGPIALSVRLFGAPPSRSICERICGYLGLLLFYLHFAAPLVASQTLKLCLVMPVVVTTTDGTSRSRGLILARLDTVVATAAKAQARSANGMNQGSHH